MSAAGQSRVLVRVRRLSALAPAADLRHADARLGLLAVRDIRDVCSQSIFCHRQLGSIRYSVGHYGNNCWILLERFRCPTFR